MAHEAWPVSSRPGGVSGLVPARAVLHERLPARVVPPPAAAASRTMMVRCTVNRGSAGEMHGHGGGRGFPASACEAHSAVRVVVTLAP